MRLSLAGTLFALAASPSSAGPDSAPWPDFLGERQAGWSGYFGLPGFDGSVQALAVHEGRLVIGGYFRHLDSRPFAGLAIWDGRTVTATGLAGSVSALVPDGPDLLVGGSFRLGDGGPEYSVARWDGQSFEPLGTLHGIVTDLAVRDGVPFVTGKFQGPLVSSSGWFDGSRWRTGGQLSVYHRLEVHRGELYAYKDRLVKVWVPGRGWETAFTASGDVRALLSTGDELLAGGSFGSIEGVPARNLARWDGSGWSAFPAAPRGTVYLLHALADGRLLAGGDFWVGTTPELDQGPFERTSPERRRRHLAIWDGTAWEGLEERFSVPWYAKHLAAAEYGGELLIGGHFSFAGDDPDARNLARWDGTRWDAISHEGQGIGGTVEALLVQDRQVYAGGRFRSAGGAPVSHVARFDGTRWHDLGGGLDRRVHALALHDGSVVAGGEFGVADGVPDRIARWSGGAWEPIGAGLTGVVCAVISHAGDLFAGGDFPGNLARWDGSGWAPVGGGLDGTVRTLAEHGGRLVVGGDFPGHVVAWDGAAFEAVGEGVDGVVYALVEHGGELVVGGDFDVAGSTEVPRLARWDDRTWRGFDESLISAWSIETSRGPVEQQLSVRELASLGGHLWVAGDRLVGSESEPTRGVIRWSGTEWSSLENGLENVRAFAGFGDAVLLGGDFVTVGEDEVPSRGVAAWRDEPRGGAGVATLGGLVPRGSLSAVRLRAGPSPFRAATTLRFGLGTPGRARITIHDVQGRLVRELGNGPRPAGEHVLRWDGRDGAGRAVPAGVYFVRLESERGTFARKILRLR